MVICNPARNYHLFKRTAGLYVIVNRFTRKPYFGITCNLHGRLGAHYYDLQFGRHHNVLLQADWDSYGPDAFDFRILMISSKLFARDMERELIRKVGRRTGCYNFIGDGYLSRYQTPEVSGTLTSYERGFR